MLLRRVVIFCIWVVALAGAEAAPTRWSHGFGQVTIETMDRPTSIGVNVLGVFSRHFMLHTGITPALEKRGSGDNEHSTGRLSIIISLQPKNKRIRDGGLSAEAYYLTTRNNGNGVAAWIEAADDRGMLYGLGRLLRLTERTSGDAKVELTEETVTPESKYRCVYFATHMNNYYETAPIEEIQLYIEEMGLWGFNTIWTWLDANWYAEGFCNDANSRGSRMSQRIREINAAAHRLGLTTGLIGIANEGFKRQPSAVLRADMSDKRGGFYPESHICPSRPGGTEMILRNRREILKAVGPIDAFIAWPFDQGGCGCELCRPWPKTFMRLSESIAKTVRELNPNAEMLVSTWYFKPEEMAYAERPMRAHATWLNGIVCSIDQMSSVSIPVEYRKVSFPEISMYGSLFTGYGASGANPMPKRFDMMTRRTATTGSGAALYSEGIFEDFNKFFWVRRLVNTGLSASEIEREYCRYYFDEENVERGCKLIAGLEEAWPQTTLNTVPPEKIEQTAALAEEIGKSKLDPRGHVRWQYLEDRAKFDAQLMRIEPDAQVRKDFKALWDEIGNPDSVADLRERTRNFAEKLARRNEQVEALYAMHWRYLERAHMAKSTILLALPPAFVGGWDWSQLAEILHRALPLQDQSAFQQTLLHDIKHWFWSNNLDLDFVLL